MVGWLGPEGTCLMVAWGPEGKRVANSGLLGVFPFTFFFFSETSNWPMNIQSSVQRQKYIKSSLAAPFSFLYYFYFTMIFIYYNVNLV